MRIKGENLKLILSLSDITFLNLSEKINLLKNLDSYNDLALMSIKDISRILNRDLSKVSWNATEALRKVEIEERIINAKNIKFLYYEQSEYPALLRESVNAPFALFYYGNPDVMLEKTVSVVGTRRITPEGKKGAFEFSCDAVNDGVTVVSGLAYGVDGEAHLGAVSQYYDALENDKTVPSGKTVAVLPCGIDTVFPASHKGLAQKIIKSGGLIISEYAPLSQSAKWHFVQRNRIIAALSPATVVIQAPNGSGALITAQFALDYGRDVMFHKAALCDSAKIVKEIVNKEQADALKLNKISKAKMENSIERYLSYGAPVIENYSEYLKSFRSVPGVNGQLKLFS